MHFQDGDRGRLQVGDPVAGFTCCLQLADANCDDEFIPRMFEFGTQQMARQVHRRRSAETKVREEYGTVDLLNQSL